MGCAELAEALVMDTDMGDTDMGDTDAVDGEADSATPTGDGEDSTAHAPDHGPTLATHVVCLLVAPRVIRATRAPAAVLPTDPRCAGSPADHVPRATATPVVCGGLAADTIGPAVVLISGTSWKNSETKNEN